MIKNDLPDTVQLSDAPALVQQLLNEELLHSDDLLREAMHHLTLSRGKNFRAQLLLTAASDREGRVPKSAVIAAAALEILHLASLVHDDVIDEAETRRGLPSVRRQFGNKPAVIAGDYLFCKCFLLVAELSKPFEDRFRDIALAMSKICLGELREYRHNGDTSLHFSQYYRIVAGKTAALFALSMYTGAILGGYEEREARSLARLGHYIGMIFQLQDDCMDYQSDAATAGKNVRHDLTQGTITLPLIFAMVNNPELSGQVRAELSPEEMAALIRAVIEEGGVRRTGEVCARYYQKAQKLLENQQDEKRRALFSDLLDRIQIRLY